MFSSLLGRTDAHPSIYSYFEGAPEEVAIEPIKLEEACKRISGYFGICNPVSANSPERLAEKISDIAPEVTEEELRAAIRWLSLYGALVFRSPVFNTPNYKFKGKKFGEALRAVVQFDGGKISV